MPLGRKQPTKTRDRAAKRQSSTSVVRDPLLSPSYQPDTGADNAAQITNTRRISQLRSLAQINHGLTLPSFDPNQYFAQNLFADSSQLPRTTKEQADRSLEAIEERRQTAKIVTANLGLNQDIVRAATEGQKLQGLVIDFARTRVENQTKFINYQTAGVKQQIASAKFDVAQQQLQQEEHTLQGMRSLTPLVYEEWQQRLSLKRSKIADLKTAALRASAAMDERLSAMSGEFQQEINAL
jgi:hypothetical protein